VTRRTAFQSLVAILSGWWTVEQQRVQARQAGTTPSTDSKFLTLADINPPATLVIHMNWRRLTVVRGGESVTIDQDELFRALQGDAK